MTQCCQRKNTSDLNTEREERKAADKVLQDNIDAEEAARIAKDNEIKASLETVPEILLAKSSNEPGSLLNLGFTTTGISINYWYAKKQQNGHYQVNDSQSSILLPAATKTAAGVMTASDKTKLDNTVQGLANEITDRTNAINFTSRTSTMQEKKGFTIQIYASGRFSSPKSRTASSAAEAASGV